MPPETTFVYEATFSDAEAVKGEVVAESIPEAADAAADDFERKVGTDPISYGTLVSLVIVSEDGGISMTLSPDGEHDG